MADSSAAAHTATMFSEIFPIISTPDLQRALTFYRDLLGARVTYEFAAPDDTLVYVSLELSGSSLGIGQAAAGEERATGGPMQLWVYADDCDRAVDRLRSAGVPVLQEPTDQPWGERVARVTDFDGIVIHIGARQAL